MLRPSDTWEVCRDSKEQMGGVQMAGVRAQGQAQGQVPALPFQAALRVHSTNPYSRLLRGLISRLSGDYFALLQLND